MNEKVSKHRVSGAWFDALTAGGTRNHYEWLVGLRNLSTINRIADFGCCSAEPLILLWLFDAAEVVVVELIKEHLDPLEEDIEIIKKRYPEALQGRSVKPITPHDVSMKVDALRSDYFDVAYCGRVLYNMSPDFQKIQASIGEMTRIVRPGGFVIAADEPVDAKGANESNHPIDISPMFESAGLRQVYLLSKPDWSYCYQKPQQ